VRRPHAPPPAAALTGGGGRRRRPPASSGRRLWRPPSGCLRPGRWPPRERKQRPPHRRDGRCPSRRRPWRPPPVPRAVAASAAASKKAPIRALLSLIVVTHISWLLAADALQDSRCGAARVCHDRGAGLSPCAQNTIREPTSRDTPSSQHAGHRRCPKEPHAQRSWHLQRSPPVQSEDLPPEVWLAESLRRRAARRGVRVITRRRDEPLRQASPDSLSWSS
jgi:hypothetical protein